MLTQRGWTLAPAYDMNPTLSEYQSLLINSSTNESNLQILLDSAEEYMISYNDARTIIEEVVNGVSKWRDIAFGLGISKREIDMFQHVYSKRIDC